MSLKCKLFNHKWNGCKCERCDEKRNEGHSFEPVIGECIEKCSLCGQHRIKEHIWIRQGCYMVCSNCGRKESKHSVKNGKCTLCGLDFEMKIDNSLYLAHNVIRGSHNKYGDQRRELWEKMEKNYSYTVKFVDALLILYCLESKRQYEATPMGQLGLQVMKNSGLSSDFGLRAERDDLLKFENKLRTELNFSNEDMLRLMNGEYDAYIEGKGSKPTNILDKYRMGLSFLDECRAFDEAKFYEFNRIIGNRFSDAEIGTQLKNAELMIKGMEDLKQSLRLSMIEAISTFEGLEQQGIDLSKYDV